MKTFYTDLVGARITPIDGDWPASRELPQGAIYRVHTVYQHGEEPMCVGSLQSWKQDEPKPVLKCEVYVRHLGELWEIIDREEHYKYGDRMDV